MVPNANARHFLLKAKQRDLIAAAGGIERAAAVCNYGKSTVGRWGHADSPDLMPLDAIFALEEETGRFDMSEAIASARGRRLVQLEPQGSDASIMSKHAAAIQQMGELAATGAIAFSDGRITPAEASQIDRAASEAELRLAELRKAAATARGDGGYMVGGDAP